MANFEVSGPMNLIRVEGKIDNIKKVFSLFMDFHAGPHFQTECEGLRSIPIKNYLVNTFDRLKTQNRSLDFFMESFPDTVTYKSRKTDIYIRQLRSMFEKIFRFKFEENKVMQPEEFQNLRLHYLDVRPFLNFSSTGDPIGIIGAIDQYVSSLYSINPTIDDLRKIKNGMSIVQSQLKILYNAFFGKLEKVEKMPIIRKNPEKLINYEGEEAMKTFNYLVNKIKNVYSHKNVKDKMNDIIVKELQEAFDEYFVEYDKLSEYITKLINDEVPIVIKDLDTIYIYYNNAVIGIYSIIMDFYCLRRMLDKDYVKNAIVYTGGFHTCRYIKILVQDFDFKITHAYFSKIPIDKINKEIKNMNLTDIKHNFIPENFYQCINIKDFPKDFQ